jgi:hypothetical protein
MTVSTLIATLLLAQAPVRPALTPAMSAQATGPQFTLDCPNPLAHSLPEIDVLNDIVLRLDGRERPPSGGTVGSILGTPGEDPVIEPGAAVRIHFILAQDAKGGVRSGQFRARFTVSRLVPLVAGRHRVAIRCLGQWSNEVTVEWQP